MEQDYEIKPEIEYNELTAVAQELYDMIQKWDSRLTHEDIMDAIHGFKEMTIYKDDIS